MKEKKRNPESSMKRQSSKKAVSSGKLLFPQEPGEDVVTPKKTRSRRKPTTSTAQIKNNQDGARREAGRKLMKYYLAREGVAFGPYTEFQVLESVRLGIFESNDLALAETGTEWLEVSELLPAIRVPGEPPASKESNLPTENTLSLPVARPPLEQPLVKPRPVPLAAHHLREHETYFADTPVPSFLSELTRGKLALAAVPVAVVILGMLISAAALQHRKAAPGTAAPTRVQQKAPAAQKLAKINPLLTAVSLPLSSVPSAQLIPATTPETRATPAPTAAPEALKLPVRAPAEQPAVSQPPVRRLEGQMSISATNGLNYQPRAIDVRLYPLARLKPYLEKRSSEASTRFEALKAGITTAEASKERLRKASDAAFDAYVQAAVGSPNRAALEQASADAKKARETATNAYYDLMQERSDILSGAFYLEALPEAEAVTQTDSQGRFSFDVPTDGEFAVVAGVQKDADSSTERYYWFVPVSVAGEPKQTVLLTNNNLSSQGYVDSLVQTVD